MDNLRLILLIALGFVLLLIWQEWQRDYGQPSAPAAERSVETPAGDAGGARDLPDAPDVPAPTDVPAAGGAPAAAPAASPGETIRVSTDVLELEIDTRGGVIRHAGLPRYPVSTDRPDEPFPLLKSTGAETYVAQSGLRSADRPAPDHYASYTAEATEYRLADGEDELVVPLVWSQDGIEVTKRYRLRRGAYLVDVEHTLRNASDRSWSGSEYRQLQRGRPLSKSRFIYTYTGGVIYNPEIKYEKIDFDDMEKEPLRLELTGGWAAMIEHYFVTAWVPDQEQTNLFYSIASTASQPRLYTLGLRSPARVVEPGDSTRFRSRLFVGPKLQHRLEDIAPGLELTVDYGIFTVLAKPLFWGLEFIHRFVGNWGVAIILLTLAIKLAFYKLSETSYRSMAKMRAVQPRMAAIRERYGHDKQRMNQALMDLYKNEKINPMGGCLPILIQIPVFIALYWVLLESVEMRQAPFMLWIDDLSTKDPYYVLPVLMGITMFAQQKLNPAPIDPVQQKVFMVLPFVFTVFFAFFPAGLVLYWFVNNLLSIAQQWVITRRIEQQAK